MYSLFHKFPKGIELVAEIFKQVVLSSIPYAEQPTLKDFAFLLLFQFGTVQRLMVHMCST